MRRALRATGTAVRLTLRVLALLLLSPALVAVLGAHGAAYLWRRLTAEPPAPPA